MSILQKLGFYSAEKLARPGAKDALVETIRATSNSSEARLGAAKGFDFYNRSKPGEVEEGPPPEYQDPNRYLMTNFGHYTDKPSRAGAGASIIETVRSVSQASEARLGGAVSFDFYNRTKVPEPPIPPYTAGTLDMLAFIRVMAIGSPADLTASITALELPIKNIGAIIKGIGSASSDMGAFVSCWQVGTAGMYCTIQGFKSYHTQPHVYDYTIISTPSGVSIIRRFITKMPDLHALISGWEYSDLSANIKVIQTGASDLVAYVGLFSANSYDLLASIGTRHTFDILASIYSIAPEDLVAAIQSVPGYDLPAYLQSIPGADLQTYVGGHYPKYLYASVVASPPKDIKAVIRSGLSGTLDLSASITGTGYLNHLPTYIRCFNDSSKKLKAYIIARVPKDIIAFIHGRAETDITAYIKGVNELNLGARIISWASENEKDLAAFIRPGWAGVKSLETFIHGWVSTHTSNKPVNFNKLSRPFNRFLLGTKAGLAFVQMEPIWGVFPDLEASISGTPLSVYDMRAFLRASYRANYDLNASIIAVTKSININKIPINFVNVSNMSVYISAFSGYGAMDAFISGWKSESTNTPQGSGWVYVSSTIKFYLGTSLGLFIPSRVTSSIRPDRFINYSPTPDLWGYLYGWNQTDLIASISVQPFGSISASLTGLDLSHVKALQAYIGVMYTYDISTYLTCIGYYDSLYAHLTPFGQVCDLQASIKPYLKVLGYRVVPVETKPLLDLRAILNPIAACGYSTTYAQLGCFIRGTVRPAGGLDLTAYLNVLSNISDLNASIIGRKITRIKLMNFMFRAQSRSSYPFGAVIVGKALSTNDMSAFITPLHHTSDFVASITPYYPETTYSKLSPLDSIDVYKMVNQNAELYKRISLLFESKTDSYVYNSIQKVLYSIGDGRWALNLSELSDTGEFFDKNVNDKERVIDNIVEYDSVDEAIRAAIVWLTEPQYYGLNASIYAIGGYSGMKATIEGIYADRASDLLTSIAIVNNEPILTAVITAYSGYSTMRALITGYNSLSPGLYANISGVVYTGLYASITGIT